MTCTCNWLVYLTSYTISLIIPCRVQWYICFSNVSMYNILIMHNLGLIVYANLKVKVYFVTSIFCFTLNILFTPNCCIQMKKDSLILMHLTSRKWKVVILYTYWLYLFFNVSTWRCNLIFIRHFVILYGYLVKYITDKSSFCNENCA